MLSEYLNQNNIELNVEACNYQEALQSSGNLLLEQGSITKEYIEEMINSVAELGPYIVITKGIAIGHARPSEYVKENCISMITLKEPVEFGHAQNDPVKIVFAIAAKNGERHLEVIQDLAMCLSEESNIKTIINAKEVSEILTLIEKY